jgi:SAM-dependent methyltransferase
MVEELRAVKEARFMSALTLKTYWETRLADNWGPHGVGCLDLGKNYNCWLYKVRKRVFRRITRSLKLNYPAVAVLDVGSGTGFYVECWQNLGVRTVTGIDLTDVAVQHLRGRFPDLTFYQMDIGDTLTIPQQGTYDVVSAFDVLFHIVDDARYRCALKNLYALLREGGFLIYSDNFLHGEANRSAPYHVSRSLSEIAAALKEAGFHVLSRTPMFVLMNHPVDSQNRL